MNELETMQLIELGTRSVSNLPDRTYVLCQSDQGGDPAQKMKLSDILSGSSIFGTQIVGPSISVADILIMRDGANDPIITNAIGSTSWIKLGDLGRTKINGGSDLTPASITIDADGGGHFAFSSPLYINAQTVEIGSGDRSPILYTDIDRTWVASPTDSVNSMEIANVDFVNARIDTKVPYKSYVTSITGLGTSGVDMNVIHNEFENDILWERIDEGIFRGTLAGAFTPGKTICLQNRTAVQNMLGSYAFVMAYPDDINTFVIETLADDNLHADNVYGDGAILEIRVYN